MYKSNNFTKYLPERTGGLYHMKVYVTDYCPNWPARYQAEAEQIKQILADNLLAIYHIGSTSVPGLAAKPIIDILVSVKDISGVDGCNVKFQQIGYECM